MAGLIPWTQNRRRKLPTLALLASGAFGVAALGHVLYHGLRKADLRGQVALITGGSRGLGHTAAQEYNELLPARQEQQIFPDISPTGRAAVSAPANSELNARDAEDTRDARAE